MNNASLNSVLCSIHPAAKIIFFIAFTLNLFVINSLGALAAVTLCLILIMIFGKIEIGIFKWLLGLFVAGLPLLAIVFVLSGYEMFNEWGAAFKWGLINLLIFTLKIKSLVLMNIIIVRTTSVKDFTKAFRSMGFPDNVTLFMTTVIRFIPLSFEEVKRIIEIQKCRGFEMKQLINPKNFLPVFIPLFISHLKKSGELALTLEIRYFALRRSSGKKQNLNLSLIDYSLLLLSLCLMLAGFGFIY